MDRANNSTHDQKKEENTDTANGIADGFRQRNTRLVRSIFHEYKQRITRHSPPVFGRVFYANLQSSGRCLGLCEQTVRNNPLGSPACSAILQTNNPKSMRLYAPKAR
jgi:hypothetical protein